MREGNEYCIHCGVQVIFALVVQGEWAHANGPRYCQTPDGRFTATPLQVAEPPFHGPGDVL